MRKQQFNEMALPVLSDEPFGVLHLDCAELKKKGEGVARTQAFLIANDECTRIAASRTGKEDANSVISMLERDIFKDTKVVVPDNGSSCVPEQ